MDVWAMVEAVKFFPPSLREAFDPSEARDADGKWSGSGSGGGDAADPTSYRSQHTSPGPDFGEQMHKVNGDMAYPDDVYNKSTQMRYYGTGDDQADQESFDAVNAVRGNPDAPVTIYRAVPDTVSTINPGDWVAVSPTYANQHAESNLPTGVTGKVLTSTVPASELYTNGDSINEWGWHPKGR